MEQEKQEVNEVEKQEIKTAKQIAVIRIRGATKIKKVALDTLNLLKLYDTHNCAILNDTPSMNGMLKKVANYITWGEIDDETLKLLKGEKTPFRLHPPRKGFERKGIKIPFKKGGALGYRGDKINDLIKRMMPSLQDKKIHNKEGRA